MSSRKVGVWIIGARGGLSTTLIVGTLALARKLASPAGLITESDDFAALPFLPFDRIVFGGHDIRCPSLFESAVEISRDTGTLHHELLVEVREALEEVDQEIREGTALNCGEAILSLATPERELHVDPPLREIVSRVREDMEGFQRRHGLDHVIVVNLASTEPLLERSREHETPESFEEIIAEDRKDLVRASSVYSWAAADLGFSLINFTPSNACLLPAIEGLARRRGSLYMGSDGKTGETLVKSALAPMFKYRNLRVLTWQGYNILGDRDGRVLANEKNKAAKVSTKDSLLPQILGYPLHTHVGIDFVPSLSDFKTAWDFIHFRGFLDTKMSLQFTWQGNDSILAAPLVLDMVRFAELAHQSGESGPMHHLACFFKQPLGVSDHDLHTQWHSLVEYVGKHIAKAGNKE